MLDLCGLVIVDVELNNINGGSFAITAAKVNSGIRENSALVNRVLVEEQNAGLGDLDTYKAFREKVFSHRDRLNELLEKLKESGSRVLGYGASTKGNVLLQFCGITSDRLPVIAEVNSEKFGAVTPGTHIPIISEQDAHAMNPDYFLVMPWHFRDNLIGREKAYLGRGGKLIFPLPEIEIVGA